ncbi:MAG: 3-oxoacyl-[acyl-carrier-protein] reductase [Candidatus Sericytochromatia bacterium]|nr:3-oxoacyl-[acyl-carrier-protein] reductase [Candidatus Sericytochromatia bacterium]
MRALQGKVALVTGASRGIGRATALRLAGLGARVAVNFHRQQEAADAVVAEIAAAGGEAWAIQADVADVGAAEALVAKVHRLGGALDVLVNNAGITRDQLVVRMKDDDWRAVIDTDLSAAFWLCRAASRLMLRARAGRIVNVASVIGLTGNAGQANYAAAKAGLIGLSKSLAQELAGRGITVNVVAPGYIASDMTAAMAPSAREAVRARIPMGREGLPEEVAAVVGWLASDAPYITGQVLAVDGGLTM